LGLSIMFRKMADASPPPPSQHQDEEPVPAFDFDKNTPEYRIWKVEEKVILRSHIQGYRGAPRKKKARYIAEKVIPEIKACWDGRYDKKKLKKDKELRKEWDKKKQVFFKIMFRAWNNAGPAAHFYLVWEQRGHRAGVENTRSQLQCDVQHGGSEQKEGRDTGTCKEYGWRLG